MIFRGLHKWKNEDGALDGLVFLAQRLNELLFDYSLDSYKPSALNAPFLCIEAINLIKDIENNIIDTQNLEHVLEELEWSLVGDFIANSLLDAPISYYILRDEKVVLSQKKIKLEVLSRTLDPLRYMNKCFEILNNHVVAINKKKIDFVSSKLITTLVNIGLSKTYLFKKNESFFFNHDGNEINSVEQLNDFFKEIYPHPHNYEASFIVSDLINQVSTSVKPFDVEILTELPVPVKSFAAKNDFSPNENEAYITVKNIKAYDHYTARRLAEDRLDNLSDLFTLFFHKKQISWRGDVVITQCCNNEPVLVRTPKGAMEKGFDLKPDRAAKELNTFLKKFSARGISFQKFNRVVDLHGICLSSDIAENQLVNIWTSLETIVPSHVGSSKIGGIISAISPFIAICYLQRIVERFTSDLILWDKWRAKKILKKVPCTNPTILQERTLNLLSIDSNKAILDELYAALKDFHLLRFRAFNLSELFNNPKKLQEIIETHQKKVAWQLRRIYRTRNLIVHSGRSIFYINTLIENGHDYLDQVLFDIMRMSCNEYRVKTLEQAFEIVKVRFQKFNNTLSAIDKFDDNNTKFILEA